MWDATARIWSQRIGIITQEEKKELKGPFHTYCTEYYRFFFEKRGIS